MTRAAELLGKKKDALVAALQALLRETAFDNRYALHPRQLADIGSQLAEMFLRFLEEPDAAAVAAYSAQLAREGLGEKTALRIASSLRAFCWKELSSEADVISEALDSVEPFATALLEGFMSAREKQILADQEQLRRALSTALATQSQELLFKNQALDTSVNGFMLADLEGKVTWVNASYLKLWGFETPEDVIGLPFGNFWVGDQGVRIIQDLPATGGWHGQLQARRADGGEFSVELSVSLIRNEEQTPVGIMSSAVDITEHLKAEELKKNLILTREIHHRVKNNLQVISSLLYLQSGYVQDTRTREMFRESQNRVRSMALLHEKLYRSKNLGGVDSSEYLTDLTRSLFNSYGLANGHVELTVMASGVTLGMDAAVPCGLIINELVSNSLKHAFPSGGPGQIRVELVPSEPPADGKPEDGDGKWYRLVVSDTGVGFPKDLDFRATESLGLKIVCTLAEQLHGTIELNREGGSRFTIIFREA